MNILIVEDEKRLSEALAQIMKEQKYTVDVVDNGDDGYDYAVSGQYDIIILDVMLPGKNGLEISRQLRREGLEAPILMLTARDEISDKVTGLDCGADDYMTKPFDTNELLARVRALTRRRGAVDLEEISYGDLILSLDTYDLRCGTKVIHLSFKEFEIMRILMSNPKVYIAKEDLICKVWGALSDAEDNNVEAYISFLRKKLSFLNSKAVISTQRKVGYRIEENAVA
ncbi:MAG: response regulator transcription factor [Oscillospiraceae bacterium]|nr:response regulator transcription factor [Oscillospiraceae bacterium]